MYARASSGMKSNNTVYCNNIGCILLIKTAPDNSIQTFPLYRSIFIVKLNLFVKPKLFVLFELFVKFDHFVHPQSSSIPASARRFTSGWAWGLNLTPRATRFRTSWDSESENRALGFFAVGQFAVKKKT